MTLFSEVRVEDATLTRSESLEVELKGNENKKYRVAQATVKFGSKTSASGKRQTAESRDRRSASASAVRSTGGARDPLTYPSRALLHPESVQTAAARKLMAVK